MNGRGLVPLVGLLAVCASLAIAGCGSDADTIEAKDPEVAFAPLVQLDPDERRRPAAARWFIERAVLWFSQRTGCRSEMIAVGRTLPAQRTERTDWIYAVALGKGPFTYYRNAYRPDCERREAQYTADQLTRPFDGAADRAKGLRPEEGFRMDLRNVARPGQPPVRRDGRTAIQVPAYSERNAEEVDGEDGIRLTYWLLYAMNEPRADDGSAVKELAHEGDWERIDVLLRTGDEADEYEPVALRLYADGRPREVSWDSVRRTGGGSHPVLSAQLGSHALAPARDVACADCPRWRTWDTLIDGPKQLWYGYGGAWGGIGTTDATTGGLGPHRRWSRGRIEAIEENQRLLEKAEEEDGF